MRPSNTAVRKQLQKWLQDLRTLAAAKEEQKAAAGGQGLGQGPGQGVGQAPPSAPAGAVVAARDASVREHVTVLLERWLRVWTSSNDQVFGQYLQLMHQYGKIASPIVSPFPINLHHQHNTTQYTLTLSQPTGFFSYLSKQVC